MRISLVLVLLASAACRDAKPADPSLRRARAGLPPTSAAQAEPAPARPQRAAADLTGTLLERIDAPPYSYLRIGTASGEAWAAVQQTDAAPGSTITVAGAVMEGFESKTLGRRFDRIVFGTIATPEPAPSTPIEGGTRW